MALDVRHDQTHDETGGDLNGLYFLQHCPKDLSSPHSVGGRTPYGVPVDLPHTPGFSVVIPKQHYASYAFAQSDKVLADLVVATKKTALQIDRAFPDVARTGMMLEGYGVDHLHAKLFPMHGTAQDSAFKPIGSKVDKFFEAYEGYISSHDFVRADDAELAAHIRSFA